MQAARIELLQAMPIFGAIRAEVLEFMLARAGVLELGAGDYFFRERDEAQSMFVLERGSASVIKSWQGRECVLHQLRAGDCFGEMALMDMSPRSASVRADEACSVIELATANFMELFARDLEQFALIQMNIGREVCRRLRAADTLVFELMMERGNQQKNHP